MRALGRARVECRHAIRGWISDEERNAGGEAQGEDWEVLTKVLTGRRAALVGLVVLEGEGCG